jgi:hypothetical protein
VGANGDAVAFAVMQETRWVQSKGKEWDGPRQGRGVVALKDVLTKLGAKVVD